MPSVTRTRIIGDLQTAALVSTDGSVGGLACCPRFDSPSVFGALLDHERGGHFQVRPADEPYRTRQMYLPDSAVLITASSPTPPSGEVVDFMPVAGEEASDTHRLVRMVGCIRPAASPDGLRGSDGTFSLCTFAYVDALARAGRVNESRQAFKKMLTYANHVGSRSTTCGSGITSAIGCYLHDRSYTLFTVPSWGPAAPPDEDESGFHAGPSNPTRSMRPWTSSSRYADIDESRRTEISRRPIPLHRSRSSCRSVPSSISAQMDVCDRRVATRIPGNAQRARSDRHPATLSSYRVLAIGNLHPRILVPAHSEPIRSAEPRLSGVGHPIPWRRRGRAARRHRHRWSGACSSPTNSTPSCSSGGAMIPAARPGRPGVREASVSDATAVGRSGCSAARMSGLIRPRTRNGYSLSPSPPQLSRAHEGDPRGNRDRTGPSQADELRQRLRPVGGTFSR